MPIEHSSHDSASRDTDDTSRLLEESLCRLLEDHSDTAQRKAAEGSWNEPLWRALEDGGFTAALEPPNAAELGIPVEQALALVRLAGLYGVPVPFVEKLLASFLMRSVGFEMVQGPVAIAPVSLQESFRLTGAKGCWRLQGSASRVPWGRFADTLLVAAEHDGRAYLAAVPKSGFQIAALGENLAREPRDQLHVDADITDSAVMPFAAGVDQVYTLGAAMRSLQMVGALDAVLRLTVQYANERTQFGRAIGKFQAIQQSIAVMAANIAAAKAAANGVIQIVARQRPFFGIAAAKVRINEAAGIAARTAHQVHGAMGFTQEYELHFLTKRLWSWRDEFGSEALWTRKLGAEIAERGADRLWVFITSELS